MEREKEMAEVRSANVDRKGEATKPKEERESVCVCVYLSRKKREKRAKEEEETVQDKN